MNLLSTTNELEMLLNAEIMITSSDMREVAADVIYGADNIPTLLSNPAMTRHKILVSLDDSQMDLLGELTASDGDYTSWYRCIGRIANPVLLQVDAAEGPESVKKQLKAEALTIRAYFHWLLVNKFAKAYFFGGKYFLACTAKFDDTKLGIQFDDNSNCTNNALLIVDADDLSFEIVRGIEVFEFCGVKHKSKLLVCARLVGDNQTKKLFAISNDGKCDDEVLKKVWVSAFCTLARPTKTKTLKKVCVLSNTNCVLHIKSELGKTQLNIFAGEFPREYIVHLKGKKFCVGFECNEFNNDMKIEELLLVFAQSDSK